jgi:perosamine synthetase
MTSAEGGMVTMRSADLNARIRLLAHHGIQRETSGDWKYQVVAPGFKYNLSDLQAAVGLAQLRRLPATRRSLRSIANEYNARLGEVEDLIELPPGIDNPAHSCHLYSIRLKLDRLRIGRDEFIELLAQRGVSASVHFIPIPLHPAFAALSAGHLSNAPARDFPRCMALYPRLISLPVYASLDAEQVAYVASAVVAIAREARR